MVLFIASLIVAFVGGIIALAMPCCFSVLLPSYFASSFKRKIAILRMTLIFAGGIAVIMLPIALGASALVQYMSSGHSLIFVAGGFLMIFLGLWSFWGHSMLPQIHLPVNLKRSDAPSVFTLGVFSGVASSCCAPVLAGIVVLSALSASSFEAIFTGLAYVLGMVFPLLITAILWDRNSSAKTDSSTTSFLQGRMVHIKLLAREFEIHSSNLIAGVMFVGMGAITVALGFTNTMLSVPGSEIFNIYEATLEQAISNALSSTEVLVGILLVVGIFFLAILSVVLLRKKNRGKNKQRLAASDLPDEK
ncbi:MAG: cytochrome c biogenesis CcdA family protein [Nitrososphaerales archaeon]